MAPRSGPAVTVQAPVIDPTVNVRESLTDSPLGSLTVRRAVPGVADPVNVAVPFEPVEALPATSHA